MRRALSRFRCAALAVVLVVGTWALADRAPEAVGETTAAHYVGHALCATCHFKQAKTWMRTPMAKATGVLKVGQKAAEKQAAGLDPRRDYTREAKCLACHATGYGKRGGYPTVVPGKAFSKAEKAQARRARGVSCEACHGAGSRYTEHMDKNKRYKRGALLQLGLIPKPVARDCSSCHDGSCPTMPKGYRFDFAKAAKAKNVHAHVKLKFPH